MNVQENARLTPRGRDACVQRVLAGEAQWHHEFESRNGARGDVFRLEWAFSL